VNAAYEAFVRDRAPALLRYGYVLTGSRHDAADLTQEALIRVGQAWSRLGDGGRPEAYARTVMARLHISWWRRRRREWLTAILPERGYADAGLDRVDNEGGPVWRALVDLPPGQRVVLALRYYERQSDAEIAETLGISRVTVRSQASRGLDKLRAQFTPPIDVLERT
jgi:RNA polymerase sigma-70 factor (sigma-E family)